VSAHQPINVCFPLPLLYRKKVDGFQSLAGLVGGQSNTFDLNGTQLLHARLVAFGLIIERTLNNEVLYHRTRW
jgi:hypothetical protein